jgi:DNA-binding NarL/FixJ family response regulator
MDVHMPKMNGLEAMIAIRDEFPKARIILITTFADDVEIQGALQAGACAYILKSLPAHEMLHVIHLVHAGEIGFLRKLQPSWQLPHSRHSDRPVRERPRAPLTIISHFAFRRS